MASPQGVQIILGFLIQGAVLPEPDELFELEDELLLDELEELLEDELVEDELVDEELDDELVELELLLDEPPP